MKHKYNLQPRQLEYLRLMLNGYSHPEIAAKWGVTMECVRKHRNNCLWKVLRVRTTAEAIVKARADGYQIVYEGKD